LSSQMYDASFQYIIPMGNFALITLDLTDHVIRNGNNLFLRVKAYITSSQQNIYPSSTYNSIKKNVCFGTLTLCQLYMWQIIFT